MRVREHGGACITSYVVRTFSPAPHDVRVLVTCGLPWATARIVGRSLVDWCEHWPVPGAREQLEQLVLEWTEGAPVPEPPPAGAVAVSEVEDYLDARDAVAAAAEHEASGEPTVPLRKGLRGMLSRKGRG